MGILQCIYIASAQSCSCVTAIKVLTVHMAVDVMEPELSSEQFAAIDPDIQPVDKGIDI